MALITIDTQVDCLDGRPFEIAGTSAVLPVMTEILEAFRTAELPIIHIVRLYKPDGSNVDLCRRSLVEKGTSLLAPGTTASQLAPGLSPAKNLELDHGLLLSGGIQELGPKEVAIYKSRWGAFYQTPLHDHLRQAKVDSLAFTGCNFPNCPRTSIYEASERDYRIVLVKNAISGLYDRGEAEMSNIGVNLMSAHELIAKVKSRRQSS
jgi:nicotinamidase-related amidase